MINTVWMKTGAVMLCSVVAASGSDFFVNTTNQCVTDNYMDGGAAYYYRV